MRKPSLVPLAALDRAKQTSPTAAATLTADVVVVVFPLVRVAVAVVVAVVDSCRHPFGTRPTGCID